MIATVMPRKNAHFKNTLSNALQQLAALKRANSLKRYPVVTGYARLKERYDDTTANGLTKCIIDFIRFFSGFAKRIQSLGQYYNGSWAYGRARRGTANIQAVYNDQHLSIEIKVGRDRMSDAQKQMRREMECFRGMYVVARSFQGFFDWFTSIFQLDL